MTRPDSKPTGAEIAAARQLGKLNHLPQQASDADLLDPGVQLKKRLGRGVALAMIIMGALAMLVAFSACSDDGNASADEWYLSGTWINNSSPDQTMTFTSSGSGYWQSAFEGSNLNFNYYCSGNGIYFTFFPDNGPSYSLSCTITVYSSKSMSITWPAGSFYGPTTITYTLQ